MKLSKVNLQSFEAVIAYVESNFNYNETAKRLKTSKENARKVYLNFVSKLNIEISKEFEGRQILTEDGMILYQASKNIIEAYNVMLKGLTHE